MEILAGILWPLIELLRLILEAIYPLVESYGLAIMLLSVIVSTALSPITTLARRLENKDRLRHEEMAPFLADVRLKYTGRERFEKTDEIYQRFNYHPIKSMGSLLPLFIQLPFLIAALILLVDFPPIKGVSFLVIPDLGTPDGLLAIPPLDLRVNLLPILLTGIAIVESSIRLESTTASKRRFLIVAAVLLVLIYPFPAGVCLYWFTSNTMSFVRAAYRRRLSPQPFETA